MPSRASILAGACVVVLAAAAGVALASIPDADGVIHACRKVDGGRLRAVVSARRCRADERPLKWKVRGLQDEPGPGLESFDALAGLGCTVGSASGTIAINYDATSGEAHIRCVEAPAPPALVRLNEFSTGTEGALADEFVELVNTGSEPADSRATGSSTARRRERATSRSARSGRDDAGGGSLPPLRRLGLRGGPRAGPDVRDVARFRRGRARRAVTPRARSSTPLPGGTATNAFVEATVATAPPVAPAPGQSAGRNPDGHDTNDNSVDFTIMHVPTPGAAN
jgi:hypothetical protein